MKKISIAGSYNLKDGYLGAANALIRKGHEVGFIPVATYNADFKSEKVERIISDLKEQSPEVVLWWRAEFLTSKELSHIKSVFPSIFAFYSWDDPLQWEHHLEMPDKCKVLDVAFSCCMDSVSLYRKSGCDAYYCPPGFDPEIHYPEVDPNYVCDISIVCTNLYHGQSLTRYPHISRKTLIDGILARSPGIDLRVYGSEGLKNEYPEYYKGWISFLESRKVFTNSKINISTHIRPDGNMYINERVTQILGCGGLLYMDKVRGIEKVLNCSSNYQTAIFIDPLNYCEQVKEILCNYKYYEDIKKGGLVLAKDRFTWDHWANVVSEKI